MTMYIMVWCDNSSPWMTMWVMVLYGLVWFDLNAYNEIALSTRFNKTANRAKKFIEHTRCKLWHISSMKQDKVLSYLVFCRTMTKYIWCHPNMESSQYLIVMSCKSTICFIISPWLNMFVERGHVIMRKI